MSPDSRSPSDRGRQAAIAGVCRRAGVLAGPGDPPGRRPRHLLRRLGDRVDRLGRRLLGRRPGPVRRPREQAAARVHASGPLRGLRLGRTRPATSCWPSSSSRRRPPSSTSSSARCEFRRADAVPIALLALLFPWASGVRLWPTGAINNVAVLLLFAGLLVALRGLRVPGPEGPRDPPRGVHPAGGQRPRLRVDRRRRPVRLADLRLARRAGAPPRRAPRWTSAPSPRRRSGPRSTPTSTSRPSGIRSGTSPTSSATGSG